MPLHPKRRVPFQDPLNLLSRGLTKLYSIWASVTYPFASTGRNLSIHYTCRLDRSVADRIAFGNSVIIRKDTWLNVSAPPDQKGEPVIVFDDWCRIGSWCQITAKNCIHIERDVIVSPSVVIADHSHAYEDVTRPISEQGVTEGGRIRIGQGSWIGYGAAIICSRGELVLGQNCVVAANAVVTRSFPPFSVIAGNPARAVRQFDPAKNTWVRLA